MPFASQSKSYYFSDTELPALGAVYGIRDQQGTMLYVGQACDLCRRMTEHRGDREHSMHRRGPWVIVVEFIADERTRLVRERQLITEYDPPCNKL